MTADELIKLPFTTIPFPGAHRDELAYGALGVPLFGNREEPPLFCQGLSEVKRKPKEWAACSIPTQAKTEA
jgi:hypothetical protein